MVLVVQIAANIFKICHNSCVSFRVVIIVTCPTFMPHFKGLDAALFQVILVTTLIKHVHGSCVVCVCEHTQITGLILIFAVLLRGRTALPNFGSKLNLAGSSSQGSLRVLSMVRVRISLERTLKATLRDFWGQIARKLISLISTLNIGWVGKAVRLFLILKLVRHILAHK